MRITEKMPCVNLNIKFDFVSPYVFMAKRMFTKVTNAGSIIVSLISSKQSRGNLLVIL